MLRLPVGRGVAVGRLDRRQIAAHARVGRGPHPHEDGDANHERRDEKSEPLDPPVEHRPQRRQRDDGAVSVDVEHRRQAGDQTGEQKGTPAQPLAERDPQHEQQDQGEAESEERRTLRHEIGEDRVQPLQVEVAIERVLAR